MRGSAVVLNISMAAMPSKATVPDATQHGDIQTHDMSTMLLYFYSQTNTVYL